jgi:hypothetical protein
VATGRPAACEYLPKGVGLSFKLEDIARAQFAATWDGLNAKRAPWSANPWVWIINFRRA